MSIGQNILKFRTAKNLSQGDLAELLDVSRQSVSKWETDCAVPDLDKLIKLCDLFEVSLDELTNRITAANEQSDCKPLTRYDTDNTDILKEKNNIKQLIGIVLLATGIISIIFGILFTLALIIFGVYLIVCGIFCLTLKKRVGPAILICTVSLLLAALLFLWFFSFDSPKHANNVEEVTTELPVSSQTEIL